MPARAKTRRSKTRKKPASTPADPRVTQRLSETRRRCDGCDEPILRWTRACFYDESVDRIYCSACAETIKEAPRCAECRGWTNPFVRGLPILPVGFTYKHWCARCAVRMDEEAHALLREMREEAEEKQAQSRRARKNKFIAPGFEPLLSPPEALELTVEERKCVEAGPFFVARVEVGIYQVVRPLFRGARFIRSSVSDPGEAFRLCARFNAAVTVPSAAEIVA